MQILECTLVIIYIYIYIYTSYSRSTYNVRGIIIKLLFLRWNDTTRSNKNMHILHVLCIEILATTTRVREGNVDMCVVLIV